MTMTEDVKSPQLNRLIFSEVTKKMISAPVPNRVAIGSIKENINPHKFPTKTKRKMRKSEVTRRLRQSLLAVGKRNQAKVLNRMGIQVHKHQL